MYDDWVVVSGEGGRETEEELRCMYGSEAIISRSGRFHLIHLDHPTPELVRRRTDEFDPELIFEDDCPLCQILREKGGHVIFDDREPESDELDRDLDAVGFGGSPPS